MYSIQHPGLFYHCKWPLTCHPSYSFIHPSPGSHIQSTNQQISAFFVDSRKGEIYKSDKQINIEKPQPLNMENIMQYNGRHFSFTLLSYFCFAGHPLFNA